MSILKMSKKIYEQNKKINTLELENETLKSTIKEELYKEFMSKLGEPLEMKRLKNENKKLRAKNKELRDILREV